MTKEQRFSELMRIRTELSELLHEVSLDFEKEKPFNFYGTTEDTLNWCKELSQFNQGEQDTIAKAWYEINTYLEGRTND